MRCVVVCTETTNNSIRNKNKSKETTSNSTGDTDSSTGNYKNNVDNQLNLAARMGKRLHGAGHVPAYIRVERWINTSLTAADPFRYGELYVLTDGTEVPKTLGEYERECQVRLTRRNFMTAGTVLAECLESDRSGEFGAALCDVSSAMRVAVKKQLAEVMRSPVSCVETVNRVEPDMLLVDVGDGVIGRDGLGSALFDALHELFGADVAVVGNDDIAVPDGWLIQEGLAEKIAPLESPDDEQVAMDKGVFRVGIVVEDCDESGPGGKNDPFCCVRESVCEAGRLKGVKVDVIYIYAKEMAACTDEKYGKTQNINKRVELNIETTNTASIYKVLDTVDGIIMPGGFGNNFVEEKIKIIKYVREKNIPFLGICLGFQLATIEFVRNVMGKAGATSQEFVLQLQEGTTQQAVRDSQHASTHYQHTRTGTHPQTSELVVVKAPAVVCKNTGRDMYLGAYEVKLRGPGVEIYGRDTCLQKFRHKYMINADYLRGLEDHGMTFCGKASGERLVMFVVHNHKFFYGVQYHPELSLLPGSVDPIFIAYISSIIKKD